MMYKAITWSLVMLLVACNVKTVNKKKHVTPYVFYRDSGTEVINVKAQYDVEGANDKENIRITFQGRPQQNFTVHLRENLMHPPTKYKASEKLLAIADIEGQFDALRNLLLNAKVIDKHYNWIFGDGHLVLLGDFMDRGELVMECLWLIYSLEEKAKQAGGYVHFILGNHELMNLSGDTRYVHPKYFLDAMAMKKRYVDLFDSNTELGRWLRTKNVIEQIGDLLFVHGGIAPEINQLGEDLEQINTIARPYYANAMQRSYKDPLVNVIVQYKTAPFWYRGYYDRKEPLPNAVIDNTLKKFQVKHVITGHTVVADTISTWYDGKIINIDTRHSAGKSEALLMEGNKYFRINTKGQRREIKVLSSRKKLESIK
ncbi:metallophosphoesterase [Fulvivirgaceae bacterium BMA12]|uniref:Metallophosphoesterase n=1 Tax=Agaribacillus aureus TaxID=3051825 RepID=A0ABT8L2N7_9BACT|nr:metallophosphoesterase [Fulvivirgaceae bacterium BMA12]